MLNLVFLTAFLFISQTEKSAEFGIIAGMVTPPDKLMISRPVQVVLLSPQYANLWSGDVQRRLDVYWERYKPAFAEKKEFFYEVSEMAYRDAIQYIIGRMRRDLRSDISGFVQDSSPEGRFEFKNVPFGEYKIVAVGKIGGQEFIWQEAFDIHSSVPQFLELKKRIP